MKKLKKFAALLLVGVMALALLTACGGGGVWPKSRQVLARITQEKGGSQATAITARCRARSCLQARTLNTIVNHAKFKVVRLCMERSSSIQIKVGNDLAHHHHRPV